MKTKLFNYGILVLSILFCNQNLISQFNQDAPWQKETSKNSNTKVAFRNQVDAFNSYWKTRDHTSKGSGYKPFKRWEEYWKNGLTPEGTIVSPDFLWKAWEKKQKMANVSKKAAPGWIPMGPFDHDQGKSWSPGQGRVNVAIEDPRNANILYVGAPAGGIWKSTNKGSSWSPLSDDLPQIGVSGIAIDYKNSNIIYIATGDDDARNSYSVGVLKSTNGGKTWKKTGLKFTNRYTTANDIYIDPKNSNNLWVATSVGLYKTTNAGGKWTKTLSGNIKDIKLKPGNANVIYAVTSNAFYRSTNAGSTFSKIAKGLPASSGRLVIDVTPANANYVYVLSSKTNHSFQGLYRSTNSGGNFSKTKESRNIFENTQAWYDLALAVSDKNANTVFVGCLNIWKSTNGGNNFTKINNWSSPSQATYTHADIHFLRYYKGRLYCGSDGGIYRSTNNGSSFSDLTKGLQIGQFYRISVAENSSSNRLVGGLQDNGGYALRDSKWYNYFGADGMDCAVGGNNSNTYYGLIQQGRQLYVTKDRGLNQQFVASGPEQGEWVTPMVSDKNGVLFVGYSKMYKVENNAFKKISNFNFGGKIDFIEIDPLAPKNMYVAQDKTIYRSTNYGVSWTKRYTFPTNITSIEVHNNSSKTIFVTTSGTNGGVYRSTDYAVKFANISFDLPPEPKLIVRHQKGTQNIYVGTYLGVYLRRGNDNWEFYSNKLPNVSIRDLEINLKDKVLIAATYGRGIWKVPLASGSTPMPNAYFFDMGTKSSPLQRNYAKVTNQTSRANYKWTNNSGIGAVDRGGSQNDLNRDLVYSKHPRTFETKVKNGSWKVTITFGDTYNRDKIQVKAEGAVKLSNINVAKGKYINKSFTTKVSDGKLSLEFSDKGGANPHWVVNRVRLDRVDGAAPSVPSLLKASNIKKDRFTLSWKASTDDIGVKNYLIYNGNSLIKTIGNTTSVTITGLKPKTLYKMRVRAKDASGKISGYSSTLNVTTKSASFCDSLKEWNSSTSYTPGNLIKYQENIFVLGHTGWKFLGACNSITTNLCATIDPWSSQNYNEGDLVNYSGYLFEYTSSGWKQLTSCNVENKNTSNQVKIPSFVSEFIIYPNPAKDEIQINFGTSIKSAGVTIFDNLGRTVKRVTLIYNDQAIDIREIPSGMYFMKIEIENQVLQRTFVKR